MKRHLFFVAVVFMFMSAVMTFADEAVLIDFSLLNADIIEDAQTQGKLTQNRATMMDFSTTVGSGYTPEQKKQMAVSLAIESWQVELASSSRNKDNQALSFTRAATVSDEATKYPGSTVLGVRIHFPLEPYNSWGRINPPFQIPAFEAKATISDDGTIEAQKDGASSDPVNARLSRFEGKFDTESKITTAYGVVKNVGVIKSIAVNVKGLNFPHGLHAIMIDNDGNENVVFLGYLNFDGWRTLRWDNPAYVNDVRNRELRVYPLYPKSTPYVKFGGFMVTRNADHAGGDFVGYFKDVKILYDKAVLEPVRDIDDEAIWGIVGAREEDRKKMEGQRFGSSQVLRYLEALKQETATEFTE